MSEPALLPAPYIRRTLAALVDLILVTGVIIVLAGLVTFVAFGLFSLVFGFALDELQDGNEVAQMIVAGLFLFVLLLVIIVTMHGYYIYFESHLGQTPGKKIFALRVVNLQGGPITRAQAVYRDMIRWYLDAMFVIPAIVAMLVTKRRQRVGDWLAQTMVIDVSHGADRPLKQ